MHLNTTMHHALILSWRIGDIKPDSLSKNNKEIKCDWIVHQMLNQPR